MKSSADKIKNFQKLLKKRKIGAFAVMDLASVNYLSDYSFSGQGDAYLLITPAKVFCFTKELYAITLRAAAPYLKLVDSLKPEAIAEKAKELKIKNPAFDPALMGYIPGNMLKKAGFKEEEGLVALARLAKLPSELARIEKACKISAEAYDIFRKRLKTGMTETAAAAMLEDIMKSLGGEGLSFTTIMAFGPDGANPHHINTERKLKAEDAVLMDYGCRYGGYCSDITRSFWHGKKPSHEFERIFKIIKGAHDAALKAAKPGMTGGELDAVCRNYIEEESGLSEHFIHSTGHGLGVQIHEEPWVRMNSQSVLREGSVFTIEPGIYFEGKIGLRYENTVVLTKKGARILTKK